MILHNMPFLNAPATFGNQKWTVPNSNYNLCSTSKGICTLIGKNRSRLKYIVEGIQLLPLNQPCAGGVAIATDQQQQL